MLCANIFLIVIVCFSKTIAEKWRDPHELNIDMPHDLQLYCQNHKQELGVLTYYKRTLKLLTKHLARNKQDQTKYDFNLLIDAEDFDELVKAINDVNYDFKTLKRLDTVLSRVHGKDISFTDHLKDSILTWGEFFKINVFSKEMAVLAFTIMLPIIALCYKQSSRQTIVLIIVFVIWGADFVLTWYDIYEDLEVDNMVDMSRYASSAPICDMKDLWFYQKWFTSFSPTEECKRYYSARYKNKNYKIGPYDVILQQVGKVMKIFRFIAKESSQFLSIFTSDIPWPLNWIVIIVVVIMGFYILQLVLFLLFGYSFKFNFAHFFTLEVINDQQQQPRRNEQHRELIQEVRQLPDRLTDAILRRPKMVEQPNNVPVAAEDPIIPTIDPSTSVSDSNSGKSSHEAVCGLKRTNQPTIRIKNAKSLNISRKVNKRPAEFDNKHLTEHRPDILKEDNKADNSSSESIEACEELNKNSKSDTEFEFVGYKTGRSLKNSQID